MKKLSYYGLFLFALSFSLNCFAQTKEQLEQGYSFLKPHLYTAADNAKILSLYKGLRESDVIDGMDYIGLNNKGLVDPAIHAAWTDKTPAKTHAFQGIAVTCRYVPTQRPFWPATLGENDEAVPPVESSVGEGFMKWEGHFYNAYSPETFKEVLFKGAVLVRDDVGRENSGIGSNNIMSWVDAGMVGVVTDGGVRDIDEIEIEKVPTYFRTNGRGVRPGRSELESVNMPVSIGGVTVFPGDVVVADGDGVVVVPRNVAVQVAEAAHHVLTGDKAGRLKLYKKLGIQPDNTVEPDK